MNSPDIKTPIGLTLPIRKGSVGYFEQSFDTFSQVKSNIINLLRTVPGERRMQPLFGSRLHTLVFEQNTPMLDEVISNTIKQDVNNWINGVIINSVKTQVYKNEELSNADMYRIYITINFTVDAVKKTDTINLVLDTNNI